MPFTFKLSQRLARMRCALLLFSTAALAACEKPAASISGPTNPGARVVKLIVSPELITLLSSQSMQFAALGLTEAGDTVRVAATWRASAGSVSLSGLYTAGGAGAATITATSEGQSGSATVNVTASAPGQVTYYSTNFTDGTTGPLDVYSYGGGSCGASTDYRDPGSAHSIKCTIPVIDYGAAALQAWFGNGRLAGFPNDPSLDHDVFQEVRFVLAPGATAALGGLACTAANSGTQFKVHKSVYGQAGSAWNGWVMSAVSPCEGNGLASEAEMWTIDGTAHTWPGTLSSLSEGTVYDVVYRYHRYTAQGCGTIAVWVNGTKVWDSPCQSYIGTTNGSGAGLLFWDGAVYLQTGLAPYTVYTLFTQATNYPIGPATASP